MNSFQLGRPLSQLIILLTAVILCSATWATNSTILKIGINDDDTTTVHAIKQTIEQAFSANGISIQWVNLPPNRSLFEAASGKIDGLAFRQTYATSNFTTLQPVDHPVINAELWVYVHKDQECGKMEDINKLQPVGVLGYKYFEFIYKNSSVGFQQVRNPENVLAMLSAKRADFTAAPIGWFDNAESSLMQNIKTCFERPLIRLSFFTFLHEKHHGLLPALSKTYKEIIPDQ